MILSHEDREGVYRSMTAGAKPDALQVAAIPRDVLEMSIPEFIKSVPRVAPSTRTRYINALASDIEIEGVSYRQIKTVGELLQYDAKQLEAYPLLGAKFIGVIQRGLTELDHRHCGGAGVIALKGETMRQEGGAVKPAEEMAVSHIDAPQERDEFMLREGMVIASRDCGFIHRLATAVNRVLKERGDGSYQASRLPVESEKARLYISDAALELLRGVKLDLSTQEQSQSMVR